MRDLLKENWRYQGNTSCKNRHNKGHNKGKCLTEAEEIKKRWQEHTEELHKKGLNDWDNHDDVVVQLEPDIREY